MCVPVLERVPDLTFSKDFYLGYNPERINPGYKGHRSTTIIKVTEPKGILPLDEADSML